MVYEPDQIKYVFPFLGFHPEWFLLGGPADAWEAQVMRSKIPTLAIAGFEPNPTFYNLQRAWGFPGLLLPYALWEERRTLELRIPDSGEDPMQELRCGSLIKFQDGANRTTSVEARTLDDLSDEFGPFRRALLWIDIEGSELQCLRGARRLMENREIHVINAEVEDYAAPEIARLLGGYGIREVKRWNANTVIDPDGSRRDWWNIIYKLEER